MEQTQESVSKALHRNTCEAQNYDIQGTLKSIWEEKNWKKFFFQLLEEGEQWSDAFKRSANQTLKQLKEGNKNWNIYEIEIMHDLIYNNQGQYREAKVFYMKISKYLWVQGIALKNILISLGMEAKELQYTINKIKRNKNNVLTENYYWQNNMKSCFGFHPWAKKKE